MHYEHFFVEKDLKNTQNWKFTLTSGTTYNGSKKCAAKDSMMRNVEFTCDNTFNVARESISLTIF